MWDYGSCGTTVVWYEGIVGQRLSGTRLVCDEVVVVLRFNVPLNTL